MEELVAARDKGGGGGGGRADRQCDGFMHLLAQRKELCFEILSYVKVLSQNPLSW